MKRIKQAYKLVFACLLIAFLPLLCFSIPANDAHKYDDKESISPRFPAPHSLDKYKTDKAFDYNETPQGESLIQRFIRWLESHFHLPKGGFGENFFTTYLWYILFAAALVFIIYMLSKNEIRGLFGRKSKSTDIKISTIEEDINTIDFAKLIEEAVKNRQYRYAVRLFYLKTLKELNDRQMINWKMDKTNRDYLAELSTTQHYRNFEALTDMFNWIWYGDFPVDETYYLRASHEFALFQDQLKARG